MFGSNYPTFVYQILSQFLRVAFGTSLRNRVSMIVQREGNFFTRRASYSFRYCDRQKDTSLQKGGIVIGFGEKKIKLTNVYAIDCKISTDYNGELSASRDAFFLMIDFPRIAEQRIANTKVMMAHEKKNASGLSKLYTLVP